MFKFKLNRCEPVQTEKEVTPPEAVSYIYDLEKMLLRITILEKTMEEHQKWHREHTLRVVPIKLKHKKRGE